MSHSVVRVNAQREWCKQSECIRATEEGSSHRPTQKLPETVKRDRLTTQPFMFFCFFFLFLNHQPPFWLVLSCHRLFFFSLQSTGKPHLSSQINLTITSAHCSQKPPGHSGKIIQHSGEQREWRLHAKSDPHCSSSLTCSIFSPR